MLPLVSVVMPCYNAQAFLREAVDCVLGQSHPRVELIVVDDGSTDQSQAILKEYGNRLVFIEQANAGPYPARNHGLSHAHGEFVAFLDADDYWAPDFLEKLLRALDAHPEAALAYCGWQNVGLPGKRGDPYIPPDYEHEDKLVSLLRAAAPWPIHAALVRKSTIDEVGGFDTHFATCMDYDLWLRIGARRRIVRVPEVLAFYRYHDQGQITSTQWRQAENVWQVKRKFVATSRQLVGRLPPDKLRELVDGALLRRGYDCYWRRDLVSARRIFRKSLQAGGWKLRDLKYLLPALLPESLYVLLIARSDQQSAGG